MTKPAYERAALRTARRWLLSGDWRPAEAEVSEVRLEGEQPKTALVVMFTHESRPGCEFGFRWPLYGWENDDEQDAVRGMIEVMIVNLEEDIDCGKLPTGCQPGEVAWL